MGFAAVCRGNREVIDLAVRWSGRSRLGRLVARRAGRPTTSSHPTHRSRRVTEVSAVSGWRPRSGAGRSSAAVARRCRTGTSLMPVGAGIGEPGRRIEDRQQRARVGVEQLTSTRGARPGVAHPPPRPALRADVRVRGSIDPLDPRIRRGVTVTRLDVDRHRDVVARPRNVVGALLDEGGPGLQLEGDVGATDPRPWSRSRRWAAYVVDLECALTCTVPRPWPKP
jgi:hypothetical protein